MAENKRKFVIGQFLLWTIGAVLISVLFFVLAVDKKNPAAFVVICCFMEAAAMGLCFISLKGKNYSGLHFSAQTLMQETGAAIFSSAISGITCSRDGGPFRSDWETISLFLPTICSIPLI